MCFLDLYPQNCRIPGQGLISVTSSLGSLRSLWSLGTLGTASATWVYSGRVSWKMSGGIWRYLEISGNVACWFGLSKNSFKDIPVLELGSPESPYTMHRTYDVGYATELLKVKQVCSKAFFNLTLTVNCMLKQWYHHLWTQPRSCLVESVEPRLKHQSNSEACIVAPQSAEQKGLGKRMERNHIEKRWKKMKKDGKKSDQEKNWPMSLAEGKRVFFWAGLALPQVDAIYCNKLEWFEWSICSCCLRTKLDQWWGDVTTFIYTSLDLFHLSMREASSPTPPDSWYTKTLRQNYNASTKTVQSVQNCQIDPNRRVISGSSQVETIGILRYRLFGCRNFVSVRAQNSLQNVYIHWLLDSWGTTWMFPRISQAEKWLLDTPRCRPCLLHRDGDSLPGNRRPERPAKWMLTDNRTTSKWTELLF